VEKLLKPLIQSFKGSFLVVDGLDLCSPQEYKTALRCFSSLLCETSVKVVICGRDELDVTMRLPGSVELKVTHEKTKDDLALFVKQYIEERNTKDGPISNDGNTLARIRNTLIDQAEAMYVCNPISDLLFAGERYCFIHSQIQILLTIDLGSCGHGYRSMSFGIIVPLMIRLTSPYPIYPKAWMRHTKDAYNGSKRSSSSIPYEFSDMSTKPNLLSPSMR
jgi:hypothetical protein